MPANEKNKNDLRSILENKSTEELEELLALDFSEQEDAEPNVEYITTILEVIHEREETTPEDQAEVDAAWQELREAILNYEQAKANAGTTEKPNLDHPCKTEHGQIPRRRPRALRYCAVVAAVIVLFCGSAYAFQWNIFQAIAQWTAETFGFVTDKAQEDSPNSEAFREMRLEVATRSDVPVVPWWAPEETKQSGEITVAEMSRKVSVVGTFAAQEREFTVKISVYHTTSEELTATYQKDGSTVQEYVADGVTHYIVSNNEMHGVTWTNGRIEGTIQGDLTVEELQKMIDSIYEE